MSALITTCDISCYYLTPTVLLSTGMDLLLLPVKSPCQYSSISFCPGATGKKKILAHLHCSLNIMFLWVCLLVGLTSVNMVCPTSRHSSLDSSLCTNQKEICTYMHTWELRCLSIFRLIFTFFLIILSKSDKRVYVFLQNTCVLCPKTHSNIFQEFKHRMTTHKTKPQKASYSWLKGSHLQGQTKLVSGDNKETNKDISSYVKHCMCT